MTKRKIFLRKVAVCVKYLENYPFDERVRACHRYMNAIDWDYVHNEVRKTQCCVLCISDAVDLFPNLSLMPGYELYAYIFPEYHGLWGRVAGIKTGESAVPKITPARYGPFPNDYELLENAVHPVSVLYADGSPEGYLDAIFAEKLFDELPRLKHQHYSEGLCYWKQPEDYPNRWKVYIDIPDWRPRVKESDLETTIWLVWSEWYQSGFDTPYEYTFLKEYRFWRDPLMESNLLRSAITGKYQNHIEEEQQPYGPGRHCCLHYEDEILIAKK